jgi:hypothetical protein
MYPEIEINAMLKGRPPYLVADDLGKPDSKLSQIIAGIHKVNSNERRQLANYYGRPQRELFAKQEDVHA